MQPIIEVACGVLCDGHGRVLIAQRPAGKIAAGKWEFPGGKIEPGEQPQQALVRELDEELAVRVLQARPLLHVRHDYRERTVVLQVWRVDAFEGVPERREQQALAWVEPARLHEWDLLAADAPIVRALQLPEHYVFTPAEASLADLEAGLPTLPARAWLRLRQPGLSVAEYRRRADSLLPACRAYGLQLILDREPAQVVALGAHGWHAQQAVLMSMSARPLPEPYWFAASVHDAPALRQARAMRADCAVLGQVLPTVSHPGEPPLGWSGFTALASGAGLPVYGIGGVGPGQLDEAIRAGAQGVAGIRAYWSWPSSTSAGFTSDAVSSRTGMT